jgi:hypothetical protein
MGSGSVVIATAELVDLSREECLARLAAGSVGRVAFTQAAMPALEAIVYRPDAGDVIFGVVAGSRLDRATARVNVLGLEAEIDPLTRCGWSVQGIGESYEVTNPDRLARTRIDTDVVVPLVRTVAIPLRRLTGYRLGVTEEASATA